MWEEIRCYRSTEFIPALSCNPETSIQILLYTTLRFHINIVKINISQIKLTLSLPFSFPPPPNFAPPIFHVSVNTTAVFSVFHIKAVQLKMRVAGEVLIASKAVTHTRRDGTAVPFSSRYKPSISQAETTCGGREEEKHPFLIFLKLAFLPHKAHVRHWLQSYLSFIACRVNTLPKYRQAARSYLWGLFYFYHSLMLHKYWSKMYICGQLAKCHFKPETISLIYFFSSNGIYNFFLGFQIN